MMKNGWLMAVVAALAMVETAGAEAVDGNLAEAVAEQVVAQFFPGEEWVETDCVEIGDGEGGRGAWGIVCALAGRPWARIWPPASPPSGPRSMI